MTLTALAPMFGLAPMQFGSGDFLWLAIVLFVLAIIAGALGYRGLAGLTMDIAKWLVIIFIVLAVIALLL